MAAKKTKSEAEATREGILDAAEQIFLQRGVARATLDEIARAANVTRGAIYWHFSSKTELFDAMLARVQMPLIELIMGLPEASEERPFEALRRLCSLALVKLTTDPQYQRVYTILHHRCERAPEMAPSLQRYTETRERLLAALEEYFARPANRQALRPSLSPALAARIVQTFMSGLHYDFLRDPSGFNLSNHTETVLDVVFQGLSKDEDKAFRSSP